MTKEKRAPQYMGTGIHVHQQWQGKEHELVKGDTFFDADYCEMVWNGKKWVSQISKKDISVTVYPSVITISCMINEHREQVKYSGYTKKEAKQRFIDEFKMYFYD